LKNTLKYYKYVNWLYPVLRRFSVATTLKELGQAMINAAIKGYEKQVIEVKDIVALARR
jgi:hypothetical protein